MFLENIVIKTKLFPSKKIKIIFKFLRKENFVFFLCPTFLRMKMIVMIYHNLMLQLIRILHIILFSYFELPRESWAWRSSLELAFRDRAPDPDWGDVIYISYLLFIIHFYHLLVIYYLHRAPNLDWWDSIYIFSFPNSSRPTLPG